MIKEDYVSWETGKLMGENGFDQDYPSAYYDYRIIDGVYIAPVPRPTLQMAMKWLREVYNLHITLPYYIEGFYGFEICDIKKCIIVRRNAEDIKYVEPEEACDAAIKYCLENLI